MPCNIFPWLMMAWWWTSGTRGAVWIQVDFHEIVRWKWNKIRDITSGVVLSHFLCHWFRAPKTNFANFGPRNVGEGDGGDWVDVCLALREALYVKKNLLEGVSWFFGWILGWVGWNIAGLSSCTFPVDIIPTIYKIYSHACRMNGGWWGWWTG